MSLGLTEKVVMPKGVGQTEPTTYLKLPPTRAERRKDHSRREIVKRTTAMAEAVGVDLDDVVNHLAGQIDGNFVPSPTNGDPDKLIHQSAALIDEGNFSMQQYHVLRMFVCRMWNLKIGAPVNYVRDFISNLRGWFAPTPIRAPSVLLDQCHRNCRSLPPYPLTPYSSAILWQ